MAYHQRYFFFANQRKDVTRFLFYFLTQTKNATSFLWMHWLVGWWSRVTNAPGPLQRWCWLGAISQWACICVSAVSRNQLPTNNQTDETISRVNIRRTKMGFRITTNYFCVNTQHPKPACWNLFYCHCLHVSRCLHVIQRTLWMLPLYNWNMSQ